MTTSTRLLGVAAAAVALVLTVAVVVLDRPDAGRPAGSPGAARTPGKLQTSQPLPGRVETILGVVSFNALQYQDLSHAAEDWERLASHPAVDLIGWQETKSPPFRKLYPQYRSRGWETWYWPDPDGPIQLAISWRTSLLELLDVSFEKVHLGGYPRETDSPFPARWVVVAQFRHRHTGHAVTLVNTHVNQHIETRSGSFRDNLNARRAKQHLARLAGGWRSTPGDVVVGTGDYNFDHVSDVEAEPAGGITRTFRGLASSSYDVLGLDGLLPTRNGRWIDYVFLADHTMRSRRNPGGVAQFQRHRVLSGYHSDHAPLLARMRLYAD